MSTGSTHEVGVRLANAIGRRAGDRPLVLGLPPRGVPVAEGVARALLAPLDVIVATELAAPGGPMVAGLAEGGAMVVDDAALAELHLTIGDLDPLVEQERRALDARVVRLRGARPLPALAGQTVVLVGEVVETGLAMRAAIAAVLAGRAADVVVATPLCSTEARAAMAAAGHDVVALEVLPAADLVLRLAQRGGPRPPNEREIQAIVARALRDAAMPS